MSKALTKVFNAGVPLTWQVNGLELHGLSWGEVGQNPVLALHGWLDNAASFAPLAPMLEGHYVVALDLTGHGHSAMRSDDASYQIWDDLPEILGVVEQLGWDTFDLVGHSRGAIISTLLASACPERVRHLVLLDAVYPPPVVEENFSLQMRKGLDEKPRMMNRDSRIFPTIEDAMQSRLKQGLSTAAARLIVERNLRPYTASDTSEKGYTWTTDARLQGASPVKLTLGQVESVLKALTMPTLLLLAKDSSYRASGMADNARRHIAQLVVEDMEGGHHFHMEGAAAETAQRLRIFLQNASQQGKT
ncbi:MAG: pimeloyl-ACP methyl ester carboxylesterase [Halioglobus sp.]